MNWKDYQEKAAEFFRSLGLNAETDVTIQGARTKHDVDVLVKSHYAGFDVTWIVECKHWKSKVSKLHVLALREIVNDTGADRGILLAEEGFQSGAIEAANLTNVQLTNLEHVETSAGTAINAMKLRDLFDRLIWCKAEYWEIPKYIRIKSGLRPETGGAVRYSGDWAIKVGDDIISKAFRGEFPVIPDEMHQMVSERLVDQNMPSKFVAMKDLMDFLEPLIENLENRINECKTEFGL